jgi:beta-lactam-binding protein with PASTA domain
MSFISYIKSAAFGKTLLKIVLLYGILIAVSWFWLKWYTDHGEYVTVPELRGMSLEEAISALEDRNLQYLVVDSVYDRKATPGAILDQNPSPESQVKEGRQVFLTIYRINPPMEKIGIKEGDFATVALIKLANKGIDFDTLYEDNNTLAGSIIRVLYNNKKVTSPDFEVPRGSKVKLVIGRAASSKVTVPDLYGKTCAEAIAVSNPELISLRHKIQLFFAFAARARKQILSSEFLREELLTCFYMALRVRVIQPMPINSTLFKR